MRDTGLCVTSVKVKSFIFCHKCLTKVSMCTELTQVITQQLCLKRFLHRH